MTGRKRALLIGGGALVVVLVIVANVMRSSGGKTAVQVGTVKKGTVTSTVRAPGRVQPETMVKMSADVPGRVVRLAVQEGDHVRRGQFLLQIDDTEYRAQVKNSEASLQAARSNRRQAEATLAQSDAAMTRKESLFTQKLVSPEELDAARAARDTDRARLDARLEDVAREEANVTIARDRLSKTRYVSPIDGTVTQLAIEEGEIVVVGTMNNPGSVIMTVANMNQMKVEAEVDETDVSHVRTSQVAKVTVDALPDTSLAGHVTKIANSPTISDIGQQEQQTNFLVDVTIDVPPALLRPGMTADVEVTTASKDSVLLVPIQAVVLRTDEELLPAGKRRGAKRDKKGAATAAAASGDEIAAKTERKGVFVMGADGKVAFRAVTPGLSSDTDYEVLGDLKPGEKVVTGPFRVLRTLKPDQQVRVEEPKKQGKGA
jgi:HlyD family secretion protein